MPTDEATIQIRSYRVCFQLERRLHKIERWRIPVPYGIPLIGIGYAAAILLTALVLARLPLAGALVGTMPWPLAYVVIPIGGAYALTRLKVDGRPALVAARAWVRMQTGPRRIAAFRAAPGPCRVELGQVTVAPDDSGASMRRGVVEGPATVTLRYPVSMSARGRTLRVRQESGPALWRGKQVHLRDGQRLVSQ